MANRSIQNKIPAIMGANRGLQVTAQLVLLIIITLLITAVDLQMIRSRGLGSEAIHPIRMADDILQKGVWPRTASYPPMVMIIALVIRSAGVPAIDPYAFNTVFLIAGIGAAYAVAARLSTKRWAAFIATLLILVNPYFVWTMLLSRDSSLEFLFLGITFWIAFTIFQPSPLNARARSVLPAAGLIAAMAVLSLVRVTGFFMSLSILVTAYVIKDFSGNRRILPGCMAALLVFGGLWSYYNYRQVGAFTLATNGGYNLFLGNHPAFLHGYPHYDIDVFLRSQDLTVKASASEAEVNNAYTRQALEFIKSDPAAFVYRTIMKSVWYWFSLEKLPNYTTDSSVASPPSSTEWIARLTPISIVPGLAYLIYRAFYLPGLFASLFAIYKRSVDRSLVLLYAPLLGLWPILALTFPDTRFKISAEAFTLPAIVIAWIALSSQQHNPPPPGEDHR